MATIDVTEAHNLGRDKARRAAEDMAKRLKEKLQIDYHWNGDQLNFKRSGATGTIDVSETQVRVQVELGLMLRPLKKTVEDNVRKYLQQGLRSEA